MALPSGPPPDDAQQGIDSARDTQLVERVLRGDAEAYGEIVSRHMRRAFSIAYRILEHREDSEDVVQEAFIRALDGIGTLERGRPFHPWFYRIVVNQALNFRRARSVRATQPIPAGVAATAPSPEHAAEKAQVLDRVRAAVARLPERQRTILQLLELEDLNSSEIAAVLGVSAGTVRWHLHEARRALREVLESLEVDT
jgi:RNA polymerase sigma-70 factor, ECF subfamily